MFNALNNDDIISACEGEEKRFLKLRFNVWC